jgi:predicted anti-sigma-YlaC factor YlaD
MNMHQPIEDDLEDFLAGTARLEVQVRIEGHLTECADCRQEVDAMREMSALFSTLRSPDPPVPAPGFYARVNQLIEKEQPAPFWAAALAPLFGKRVALASLLALATLGTVLVSRETQYTVGPSAEMVLAVEKDSSAADAAAGMDRDQMLYTLASDRQ